MSERLKSNCLRETLGKYILADSLSNGMRLHIIKKTTALTP